MVEVRRTVHGSGDPAPLKPRLQKGGELSRLETRPTTSGSNLPKGAGWLANILLGAVSLGCVFVFLSSHLLGWRFDAVTTGSMEPTFKVGGMVVVRSIDATSIERGAVITYQPPTEPAMLITHRVVEIVKQGGSISFRTKGDANDTPDPLVIPSENVRGEVWLYIPWLGHFVTFAKSPLGFILCMAIPAALIVWGEGKKLLSIVRSASEKG